MFVTEVGHWLDKQLSMVSDVLNTEYNIQVQRAFAISMCLQV